MRETCEFRVVEEFAPKLFAASEGKRLGDSVRQVEIPTDDPRFNAIGQLQMETRAKTDRSFFYGWILRRRYSKGELEQAALFRLKITSAFEPAGEECGTKYDESTACPRCGTGAMQVGPLILDVRRIPKSKAISRTIAGEIVVSHRVVELLTQHRVTGVEFMPIRSNRASTQESKEWFQLHIRNDHAEIISPTRIGVDPFDDDPKGECRCSEGDLVGLNLLSEVSIKSTSRGEADMICSRQFIGTRRGLLRPERVILISAKVRRLIESEKLNGCEVEIAHMV